MKNCQSSFNQKKYYRKLKAFALSSLEISQKLGLLEIAPILMTFYIQIKKEDLQSISALEYPMRNTNSFLTFYFSKRKMTSLGNLKTKIRILIKQKDRCVYANEKELAKQNVYTYFGFIYGS